MTGLGPWLAALAVLAVFAGVRAMIAEPPVAVMVPAVDAEQRRARRLWTWRRHRAPSIDPEVPQLLDLLAAGSGAGLSAELALRSAAEVMPGPLGDDLRAMFVRADAGARWRDEFGAYAERSGSRDLRRTVTVLERTERLGSSLADACADLAASVRSDRRAKRLERARTAPVKMLFPLVFLILPAFLLLTVVPVLLATVGAIA
jgi:tight adherence protein C